MVSQRKQHWNHLYWQLSGEAIFNVSDSDWCVEREFQVKHYLWIRVILGTMRDKPASMLHYVPSRPTAVLAREAKHKWSTYWSNKLSKKGFMGNVVLIKEAIHGLLHLDIAFYNLLHTHITCTLYHVPLPYTHRVVFITPQGTSIDLHLFSET